MSIRTGSTIALIAVIVLAVTACGRERSPFRPIVIDTTSVIDTVPTPPPPAMTLVAAGNIANCNTHNADLTARLIDGLPNATVVALGDNAMPNGRLSDYQACYDPSWGRFKSRTYAVVGTHELDSSATAAGMSDYFGDRAGPAGKGYYSFDLGAWHVIVLNTVDNTKIAWSPQSQQQAWLHADLAAHASTKCTMAIWHDAAYLSSTTPGFTVRSNHLALWQVLHGAHVDVVLNGSQHDYERMTPLDASGNPDSVTGIRQFNSGAGGDGAWAPTEISPFSRSIGTDYGVLKFTLKADSYDWQFIPIAGSTFTDAGTGTCR